MARCLRLATHFRRDKQQGLTVRPELVEGSLMVRQTHHERLNFKFSRLKWVALRRKYKPRFALQMTRCGTSPPLS